MEMAIVMARVCMFVFGLSPAIINSFRLVYCIYHKQKAFFFMVGIWHGLDNASRQQLVVISR